MKKAIICVMLSFLALSCSKGIQDDPTADARGDEETPATESKSFMADADATETRSYVDADGATVCFSAGDALSVFDGTANRRFTTTGTGKKVIFSGEVAFGASEFSILYPYQESADCTDGKISAVIPAEQTATEGSYDPAANLSFATTDKDNFCLSNACTLIRFNTTRDCATVILSDMDGKYLAGPVIIDIDGRTVTAAEGASKTVTLRDVKADKIYYIALIPQESIKLHLEFTTPDGVSYARSKSTGIALPRSTSLNIGKIAPSYKDLYVDMGFPSGTCWATCNVGAESPTDQGYFLAWGETHPKPFKSLMESRSDYDWFHYFDFDAGTFSCRKYTAEQSEHALDPGRDDNRYSLLPEDDAATVNWGEEWRTPTRAQMNELVEYCDYEAGYDPDMKFVNVYNPSQMMACGSTYIKFTSKYNGHSIILPINGYRREPDEDPEEQFYLGWSQSSYWNVPHDRHSVYWTSTLQHVGPPSIPGMGAVMMNTSVYSNENYTPLTPEEIEWYRMLNYGMDPVRRSIDPGFFRNRGGNIRPVRVSGE